jgi:hypothetical protein
MVSIHKKDNPIDCNNYCGISLIKSGLKILAKIISNRISKYGIDKGFIRSEQYGFRNRKECISLYTLLRIICQGRKFENKDIYLAFLDLRKAFLNTVIIDMHNIEKQLQILIVVIKSIVLLKIIIILIVKIRIIILAMVKTIVSLLIM